MFTLFIVSPENLVYEGPAMSLIAPGTVGYFEVLTHHAPMIAGLQQGQLTLTLPDGNKIIYAVDSGFLEVDHDVVNVLVDSIELASDIDVTRATGALKRAQRHLTSEEPNVDIPRAKEALKRAENRIKTAKYKKP